MGKTEVQPDRTRSGQGYILAVSGEVYGSFLVLRKLRKFRSFPVNLLQVDYHFIFLLG